MLLYRKKCFVYLNKGKSICNDVFYNLNFPAKVPGRFPMRTMAKTTGLKL